MEIEIISTEYIKPASPTPHHLKTFNLSAIDSIGFGYVPLTLYYPNNNGNNVFQALERSVSLKKSLSETLTQFYPLAGTFKNDHCIDCNDAGAQYLLALVHCRLDEFLAHPDHGLINRLLPFEPNDVGYNVNTPVTSVQVSILKCGGIAIGLCISHKILDMTALHTFLKGWANMANGAEDVVYPNLSAPSLFPAERLDLVDKFMATRESWVREGKCITKRFVFGSDAIANLKAEATRNGAQNPTRVEVVSGLIWKCAMAASKQANGFQKPSRLMHVVTLRRKLTPSLSSTHLLGNMIWYATCEAKYESEATLHGLVKKLHEGISRIDAGFVERAQGDEGSVWLQEFLEEMGSKETKDSYNFTSWCKMGFYEIDFGWGKPSWVSTVVCDGITDFRNRVILVDTKCGGGIEVWVILDEKEMEIFQGNPELLSYAEADPSPLPNHEVDATPTMHDAINSSN